MVQLHNRTRVLTHIKYRSTICRCTLLLQGPRITEDEADALAIADAPRKRKLYARGMRAHMAEEPAFRLPGPPIFPILEPGKANHHHVLGVGRQYYRGNELFLNCLLAGTLCLFHLVLVWSRSYRFACRQLLLHTFGC